MAIWRSTTYVEKAGSPEVTLAVDGRNRAQRTIFIDYTMLRQCAEDFLGWPAVANEKAGNGGVITSYITRTPPHALPMGFSTVYSDTIMHCTGISSKPIGKPSADLTEPLDIIGTGAKAEVVLEYESLPYRVASDADVLDPSDLLPSDALGDTRYITKLWRPTGKIITLRNGMLKYVPDAVPLDQGFPLNVAGAELVWIWHQVPIDGFPRVAIQNSLGKVNSVTYGVGAFKSIDAETLLLISADLRPTYWHPAGVRCTDITYRFLYQPNLSPGTTTARGHNWMYRVVGGAITLSKVTDTGAAGGNAPFGPGFFYTLFRPDV